MNMFTSAKFYIIVGNNSFIIKKEGEGTENIIDFQLNIPNIPFYHHLFDKDKIYITENANKIKRLRMKNATIIIPDDSIDIEVDRKILSEYFMLCGAKKVKINSQCFLLNLDNSKYVSISKTTRTIVMQYIDNNRSLSKKYYDKDYTNIQQIELDMKNLHTDCEYGRVPVYINNINNEMDRFKAIGKMISLNDLINNLSKYNELVKNLNFD